MKRYPISVVILLAILFSFVPRTHADEGMWVPLLLKNGIIQRMHKEGFKLTAEDIYSINHSSLKDAVAIFDGGCTSEFISPNGLLLTNHHCGYDAVQKLSSVEHDYLTDGYASKRQEEDLPCKGLSIEILSYMKDVTSQVLDSVDDSLTEEQRAGLVKRNIARLKKEYSEKDPSLEYLIKPLFYGNQYYLYAYQRFGDVRLVVVPPSAIGKFGGDTDNWIWPRHTGDFSLFRVYANADNQPTKGYEATNQPYHPKKFLKINAKGVKVGDFTMVYGYPGSTQRYLTSYAIDEIANQLDPMAVKLRDKRLDIIRRFSSADNKVRIQYASKYASIANAWKKWQGEILGLKRFSVAEKKREQEAMFAQQLAEMNLDKKYGALLPKFEWLYAALAPYNIAAKLYREAFRGSESANFALRLIPLLTTDGKLKRQLSDDELAKIKSMSEAYFKDYAPQVDMALTQSMMYEYYKLMPESLRPDVMLQGFSTQQATDHTVESMLKNSPLAHQELFNQLFQKYPHKSPDQLFAADPMFNFVWKVEESYAKKIKEPRETLSAQLTPLYRKYVKALQEVNPDGLFFPDANFTLRVAFGKVQGYTPRDGMEYVPFTTLNGVMDKVAIGAHDWISTPRLNELYESQDYGRWQQDGEVPACFLASNHTTGGNSGSPILDKNGYLIGLNFDRTWEGTMSDLNFDESMCRNISVDIRYVMFLIDKYSGCDYLLDEMEFVQ